MSQVRAAKREAELLMSQGLDDAAARLRIGRYQAKLREHVASHGYLVRDYDRERVALANGAGQPVALRGQPAEPRGKPAEAERCIKSKRGTAHGMKLDLAVLHSDQWMRRLGCVHNHPDGLPRRLMN